MYLTTILFMLQYRTCKGDLLSTQAAPITILPVAANFQMVYSNGLVYIWPTQFTIKCIKKHHLKQENPPHRSWWAMV